MVVQTDGVWSEVIDTTIMGIHQVLLGDGRVLYWGDNGDGNAFSGNQSYGIYDPKTGEHEVLSESYAVRMFCGAGVLIPGTDQILISAGYSGGADDSRVFDTSEGTLITDPEYALSTGRFYPTMISLSTGQLVIMGGNGGGGKATPEIFTAGEGWRNLDGATDPDVGANWWYPDAWVNSKGEVLYIAVGAGNQNGGTNAAGTFEVMALDPSGGGSIRQVGEVPFQMDVRSGAAMYDIGKVVIMDHTGDLWIMDINGDEPTFTFAADLEGDRENGDMTVLPDGRILLNGGSRTGNSQEDANAVFVSEIFDPYTGTVKQVDDEEVLRVYHSSSILLPDGTVMSSGGGGLGGDRDFWDAQIYSPDYLFNDDGTLADRPVISAAPADIEPGDSFVVTVDDAATIARMSFVKTGAVTHSTNMESGRMDLDFTVLSPTQIELSLPENPHLVGAGNWMLFAIDNDGVPSEAPIISVMPTVPAHLPAPEEGKFIAQFFDVGTVSSLSDIDFAGAVVHTEQVEKIQYAASGGSFYEGGETDTFAARFVGKIEVAEAGSYTFYLTSDDGSALYVNGEQVIGNDGLHGMRQDTVTLDLDAGPAKIEVRYFENRGSAGLDLDWSGPGFGRVALTGSGELPPPPPPPPTPEPGMFTAQYFDVGVVRSLSDINFGGTVIHSEAIEAMQFARTAGSFYEGGPVDTFAGRFTGTIEVAETGSYTFYLTSDDGSALYINGEEVIGNDGLHGMRLQTATVDLDAGPADIEVRYFENGGVAGLDLDWSGPGLARTALTAAENLITNGDFEDISNGTGPRSMPEGWDTSGAVSGVFNASAARGDGYAYALGGWSGAGGQTLSQAIHTIAGESYTLTFDAGGAYGSITGALDVLVDGVEITSLSDAALGNSSQTRSYSFIASSEKTDISFVFDGTGGGDIDIDNVSAVVATQDRAALALDQGGLEGTGLGNGAWTSTLQGWDKTGNAGVWNPRADHFDFEAFAGENVGFINSGSVSQTLDATYDPTLAYEVSLQLGGRKGSAGSDYSVALYAGDTVIAQSSSKVAGQGSWDAVKLQAGVGGFDALAGEALRIEITDEGGPQLNFDAVTLTSIDLF
ncbi:MAG: PA14 domain-containing protein [Pseudomonadota bacterium]